MISPPHSALWFLWIPIIACLPFVSWIILPLIGRRELVLRHMARPQWWTPHQVIDLASTAYWVDIFCKNQYVVNSEDTATELSRCIQQCGSTALACSAWQSPSCLGRVWWSYHTAPTVKHCMSCAHFVISCFQSLC